jgi:hypothetical protein
MKKVFIITFLFISTIVLSQAQYSIEKKASRVRLSGETMFMDGESNIGMVGIGYDIFGLIKKHPSAYFGINSYSAMTGERAGVFSFGIASGIKKKLFKNLFYDFGIYLGGGGGGGAPDGGGLIVRPHFELEQKISNLVSLKAGIAKIDFPTGTISSTHFSYGLTFNGNSYMASKRKIKSNHTFSSIKSGKFRISLVGTVYNNFYGDLVEKGNKIYVSGTPVKLMGIQFDKYLSRNFYASLEFNGAFSGGVDGYMSYFLGGGMTLPIIKNKVFFDLRLLAGPSGGGGVATGGGASFQAEAGLGVDLFKNFQLKFLAGKTYAPNDTFEVSHFDIVVGKTFEVFNGIQNESIDNFEIETDDFNLSGLSLTTFNRTYFPPYILDKKGNEYDRYFNLIGFEMAKKLNKKLSLVGSTIWAYQGSYGAYGEGWLGLMMHHEINEDWDVNLKAMTGAGGGGDISLGGGLLFQYTVGIEKVLSNRFSLIGNFGRFEPLKGNFKPIIADIGLKFQLGQLSR